MRIRLGDLRRIIREYYRDHDVAIGYPFGNRQMEPTEPAGSMPPATDHTIPQQGENLVEPETDGLDTDKFDVDVEEYMTVLRDPYVRDTFRR